jgi:hypothetical protein
MGSLTWQAFASAEGHQLTLAGDNAVYQSTHG